MAHFKSQAVLCRGTTATYHLKFPGVAPTDVKVLWVTFAQKEVQLTDAAAELTKMLGQNVTIDSDGVTVQLSQDETLKFDDHKEFYLQIRGLLKNGFAFASQVVVGKVLPILKDGVIA